MPENSIVQAKGLQAFYEFNPHVDFVETESEIVVENPWGRDDCKLAFLKDADITFLNSLRLDPLFDAVINVSSGTLEFAFTFLHDDDEDRKHLVTRKFNTKILSKELECSFAPPSKEFLQVAAAFSRDVRGGYKFSVPQMEAFRDWQIVDTLTEKQKKYFEKRTGLNFFVHFKNGKLDGDLVQLVRNLNFIMNYYDRKSPEIVIHEQEADTEIKQVRYLAKDFPKNIILKKLDPVLLNLIKAANNTEPRNAFIYFFQVLEYASFYYLDDKARKALKKIVRDPNFADLADEKIFSFYDTLTENLHSEEAKLKKIIEESCNPEDIWKDLMENKDFFTKRLEFEGGFELAPLIAADTTLETWKTMWLLKTIDNLTKIRNCVVHAREKRESRVILPNLKNDVLINQYLPIISRIAEQVAIHNY